VSEMINWTVAGRATGGPVVTAAGALPADAYDKLEVTIPAATTQAVKVAPGNWTSVLFLALNPTPASDKLSYKVDNVDIAIDGPHFLIGAGAVALLGNGAATLSITNATGADATIDIRVGPKPA
jgi:hypothetical protein